MDRRLGSLNGHAWAQRLQCPELFFWIICLRYNSGVTGLFPGLEPPGLRTVGTGYGGWCQGHVSICPMILRTLGLSGLAFLHMPGKKRGVWRLWQEKAPIRPVTCSMCKQVCQTEGLPLGKST